MHLKVDLIRLGYLSIIYLLSYCNGTVCFCITDEDKPRTINNFYAKSATVPTSSATAPVAVTQTRLEHSSAVGNNHSLTAEVLWALKVVTAHYSYHSCETIAPLFARMFPDSTIAAKFSCGEKKCAYLACFGIAPFFTQQLIADVKRISGYVIMFDESGNKATQTKQMDLHVRFWDEGCHNVTSRYLTSQFMGHSSATTMLEEIVTSLRDNEIDITKIVQVSMDGPNVNWKLHRLLMEHVAAADVHAPKLLDVGSCSLHVVHNAFKAGASASEWGTAGVLSALYWLFVDSPARREDFSTITGSSIFPQKYCKHRWLENVPVAQRAMDIWPNVCAYVKAVSVKHDGTDYTEPSSKSYRLVKDAVADKLLLSKLAAFMSIATQLQPFLTAFQSDNPLMPFVCGELSSIVRALMKRIVKPDILDEATNTTRLLAIKYKEPANCLHPQKFDVGYLAGASTKELLRKKEISEGALLRFRNELAAFVCAVISKIIEKTPIGYAFARRLACLDPVSIATSTTQAAIQFKLVVDYLVKQQHLQGRNCDELIRQYNEFLDSVVRPNSPAFKDFDFHKQRLDEFLHQHVARSGSFAKLWDVMRTLLILSHGQASVEKGFSINRQVVVENLKERSFIAQRTIHDHLLHVGGLDALIVDKPLLSAAASGRRKYTEYLERQRADKAKAAKGVKRKALSDDITALEKRQKIVQSAMVSMNKDADTLSEQAEAKNDMTLVMKSNAYRRSAKVKGLELASLAKEIAKFREDLQK